MDALPPSLPNAGQPPPVPAATAGLAILLAALTEELAKLSVNTQISAQVLKLLPLPLPAQLPLPDGSMPKPLPAGTLVQISTPDGPAQIRLPPQIQVSPGAKLDITVVQGGAQPQWRLLAVDGKPVGPTSVPLAAPPSASPPAASPLQTAAPVQIGPRPPPSPGISATIVTSADPSLPAGSTVLVRITSLTPPQSQPVAAPAPETAGEPQPEPEPEPPAAEEAPPPPTASSPAPATSQAPVPTDAPASAPAPAPVTVSQTPAPSTAPALPPAPVPSPSPAVAITPPPSSPPRAPAAAAPAPVPTAAQPPIQPQPASAPQVAFPQPRIATPPLPPPPLPAAAIAAAPVPVPTSAPASPPPPSEVNGQVLPNTDGGKPLVLTPVGLLSLDSEPQTLPPDSEVTLQIIGKPVPPPAFIPTPPLPDDPPDRALPRHLTQLVAAAQDSGNDRLADAVRDKIPSPGPKLAAQILSVAASVQSQAPALARFLGDSLVTALTHAAPQALDALARHWESPAQPVQGPGEGDWRMMMIPFLMNGQMTTIRLTARHRQGKMSAAEREKGTRFLLDLDLSRLGQMQFDGLVKRQHKRFDLIIRTIQPLPGDMRRDIDALFLNGLMNFGLEGSISFQPEGRFVTTQRRSGDSNGIIFA